MAAAKSYLSGLASFTENADGASKLMLIGSILVIAGAVYIISERIDRRKRENRNYTSRLRKNTRRMHKKAPYPDHSESDSQ